MAEAETSSARLAITEESVYGTNPATGAQFLRITSESLKQTQQRVTSEEVTGNRNPRESIRTGINAEGGVDFEFSVNNFDMLIEGAMMNDLPSAPSAITGTIGAVASTQKFTSTVTDLSGISKGQWFRVGGMADDENNGIFRAAANSTVTEISVETGSGLVDASEASGKTVQPSQMIRPSNSLKSYTLERQWTDITVFEQFNGMVIESLDLSLAVEQTITGSVSFMGKDAAAPTTSAGIGTIAAAGTEQIAAAVEAFRNVREGGYVSDTAYRTTELSLSFSNATRIKKDAASLTPFGVGLGVIEVTASWKVFLANKNLIDKYRNNTTTPLSFRILGPGASDPTYIFTMPKARIVDLSDSITGNSEDGFINLSLAAETDTNGVAFQIDKLPAI